MAIAAPAGEGGKGAAARSIADLRGVVFQGAVDANLSDKARKELEAMEVALFRLAEARKADDEEARKKQEEEEEEKHEQPQIDPAEVPIFDEG